MHKFWVDILKLLSNLSLHFFLNRILCGFKKWLPVLKGMTGNGILRPYVPAPGDNRGHSCASRKPLPTIFFMYPIAILWLDIPFIDPLQSMIVFLAGLK
ncbi:hypothetical protein MBAV_005873 [Candidatus Magnetobacterium bavaricum]|uniref:Uncharacterized protein n=1 Tax=Candidatus Magnetobacterium bavaricum TaxID=29290 RepID=A0A0F3GIZ7_9BACT|nr:hypothetical protein MBAV_005873 [Candidatus Magnetobacterium bavaricum]